MDLGELHQRTGIAVRRLRYCLDHALVPELHVDLALGRAGRPRQFSEGLGFVIVCAAVLLDTGLPHEKIRLFLRGLMGYSLRREGRVLSPLVAILQREGPAFAYLGDGVNVRIEAEAFGFDSGWFSPQNLTKFGRDYAPRVEVRLNLGKIRDEVFAS